MAGPWVRGSQAQVRVRLLPGKLGWEHVVWGGDRLVWVSLAGKGRPPRDAVDMHEVHVHTHSQALLPNLDTKQEARQAPSGRMGWEGQQGSSLA